MSSSTGPIGAALPPPGETPDFDNPRDAGHKLHMVYMCLVQAIVVLFFTIRAYVKLSVIGKFQLEDWSCLVGWVFTVLLNTTVLMKLHFGEGFHTWEITANNFREVQKWLYIGSLLYSPAAFFTKTSILLLTMRVFSVNQTIAKKLHSLLLLFLLCYVPAEVAKAAVCVPISAFWDPSIPSFECIDQTKLFIYDSSLSIVSDFIILILPIVLTWRLRVSILKKIKIMGLLGAGGVAVVATIYRLFLVVELEDSHDPAAQFLPVDWTTTGELAIGMVCACLPSINYLCEHGNTSTRPPDGSLERITQWKEAFKKYIQPLPTRVKGCESKLPTENGTRLRIVESMSALAAAPESGRSELQQSDNDIDLEAFLKLYHPHPGELVSTERGGQAQSRLAPLPAIWRSSPFRLHELP